MAILSPEQLVREGILEKIYGKISLNPTLALPIWARSKPKPLFSAFARLAEVLSRYPLVVLVDDAWTMVFTGRSLDEQNEVNELYSTFFTQLGCSVEFSSRFLPSTLEILRTIGRNLKLQDVRRVFPIEKRENFSSQTFQEMMHVVMELAVLNCARNYADVIVMGSFSEGMASLYRLAISHPLPVVITPKFEGEDHVRDFTYRLNALKSKQEDT